MSNTLKIASSKDGITLNAIRGDGSVLLAFDLLEHLTPNLAGFAVKCTPPGQDPSYLKNRLNFKQKITSATSPEQRERTPSNEAPFQKFRWTHFPEDTSAGLFNYEVTAMYFDSNGKLIPGPSTNIDIDLSVSEDYQQFELGFTRGYLSSQAYAEKFNNDPIRPEPNSIDFDTSPYEEKYSWLGYHARKMLFNFLTECLEDSSVTIDVFAYDLSEPDFIRELAKFGDRLRAFLDNSSDHKAPDALEVQAAQVLTQSAGKKNIRAGHFGRFAHNKVMIKKVNGVATKVLTGSANFTLRGLYVQANNVLILDDIATAKLYEASFNQAFTQKKSADFKEASISKQWFELSTQGLPVSFASFSPHDSDKVSLDRVADAIHNAKSSVLFAIMSTRGSGRPYEEIRALAGSDGILSYGITQSNEGLSVLKPGQLKKNGIFVPFDYLTEKVPAPFRAEYAGGQGKVIHHKFVVVDFNDVNPIVFTGSSNLAGGGETNNGDNLLAIYDRSVASTYAVEAVRLVDHYQFRAAMRFATRKNPLQLQDHTASTKWWQPYYTEQRIKYYDRTLFIR